MARGSCLCGDVRYEIDDPAIVINHCHCSMCRKGSGSAFGTFLHVSLGHFRWLAGEERVKVFEKTPNNPRAFCTECGARVPSIEAADDHVIVPAGSLDDDPGLRPAVHIHVASKAPWHEITDDLPKFDASAPDEFFAPFMAAYALRHQ